MTHGTSHTFVHTSALVRGTGGLSWGDNDWTPPAATDRERETVARFGGYRDHEYGGVTLGDRRTRDDLTMMTGVTLVATGGEGLALGIAEALTGYTVATLIPRNDNAETAAVIARMVAAEAKRLGLERATLVHGRTPQWKGALQRALALGGAPLITVETASPVTGYVNDTAMPPLLGSPRRTLILDLDAVLDDGALTPERKEAVHRLAREVGAYRTVILMSDQWQVPHARLLSETLPDGHYADIEGVNRRASWAGSDFADELTAASHYRRSLADDFVVVRGDDAMWEGFDAHAWVLGAPVTRVNL